MWAALIGALFSAQADQKAGLIDAQQLDLIKQQLAEIAGIDVPELERIAAEQLPDSEFGKIERDDGLRGNQLESLAALRDIANNGGMSLDDRVGYEEAQSKSDAADYRRREGIRSQMQQRGQMDSGAALMMQLDSAQDAANRDRAAGQEFAGRSERRRLEALKDVMSGAGNLRDQDFGEAARKAAAQDEINRWNAGAREKAAYYNAGLPQQNFNNRMAKALRQNSAGGNLSAFYGNQATGVRGRGAAMGSTVGNAMQGASEKWKWGDGYATDEDREDAEINRNDDD